MRPNQGHLPPETAIIDPDTGELKGHRDVHVTLRNGWSSHLSGAWPAISRSRWAPPTRWTLERHPFDILEWEIAK